MIFLMIDNTSLLHLSQDQSDEDIVGELESMIEKGQVTLFSHDLLNDEWNRHKNAWKSKTANSSSPQFKEEDTLKTRIERRQRNTEILDRLLKNADKTFQHNSVLEGEVGGRIRKGEAPFRNGSQKSLNDWNIIGSFCLHCQSYGFGEVHFISHNYRDFADPLNYSEIDPSIAERFPKVKINYFRNYSDFFKGAHSQAIGGNYAPIAISSKFSFKSSKLSTRKNGKVIDSLVNLFGKVFEELNYVPPRVLTKFYPFSISEEDPAVYSGSCIHNCNEDLVKLIKSVKITGESVTINSLYFKKDCSTPESKVEFILRKFLSHILLSVRAPNEAEYIDIPYLHAKFDDDLAMFYHDFRYDKATGLGIKTIDDIDTNIKHAYFCSQIGDYYQSYLLYDDARKKSKKKNKYISYLISLYNLNELGGIVKWQFNRDPRFTRQIIDRLTAIDLASEISRCRLATEPTIADMFQEYRFFYKSLEEISKTVENLIKQYNSQLYGGRANNNFVQNLTIDFCHLDTFLAENGIIFDHYSDFAHLFDLVFKGLIASIAIKPGRGSRLDTLDDYWVAKCLQYGDKSSMSKHLLHFKLQKIPYRAGEPRFEFNQIAANFFASFSDDQFVEKISSNYPLREKCHRIIENFIFLGSNLELTDENYGRFLTTVVDFYLLKIHFPQRESSLLGLMRSIGRYSKISDVLRLVEVCYSDLTNDNIRLLTLCFECLEAAPRDDEDVAIHPNIINSILLALGGLDKLGSQYARLLISLFRIAPELQKGQVLSFIRLRCYNDHSILLTCSAISENLIDFDEKRFLRLATQINPLERRFLGSDWLTANQDNFSNLEADHIVNLCFRFGTKLTSPSLEPIRSLNSYYGWLLDMNGFDYSDFDPEWIIHLNTKYAFNKMAACKPLLNHIRLNKSSFKDERILNAILEIFGRLVKH